MYGLKIFFFLCRYSIYLMLACPSCQTFEALSFQTDFIYTKDQVVMVIVSQ